MRTAARVFFVVLAVILVAVSALAIRMTVMGRRLAAGHRTVAPVDLSLIADGRYAGSFGDFLVKAEVELEVRNGRIVTARIVSQECGPGYEAAETIDRIVAAQSPLVDVVSGATGSSMSIMVAAHRALTDR
ncbi:MAG: FMN-binding protein [Spirochaetaceae bacterium]|nr:MAG: FMN-binding protein [Spirochaetaceae bacterium]